MGSRGTPITVALAGTVAVANLYNRGTLLLGLTRVALTGLFEQFASGTLDVTLTSSCGHGYLTAAGTVTLAWSVRVSVAGTNQPPVGMAFTLHRCRRDREVPPLVSPSGKTFKPT